ncbi:glycine zipper 2TM domain-containing protein [Bartonella sp. DGB1]|uniref:glycine zipper 2TM domain-containing protein n=1 Tax=Bartonella sp. DGB1 TaxID=3239807 RepID=UPI0035256278
MKLKHLSSILAIGLLVNLAACTTNDQVVSGFGLTGATVGALAGGALTGGPIGTIAGTAVGGWAGAYLGKQVIKDKNGNDVVQCRYKDQAGNIFIAPCKE